MKRFSPLNNCHIKGLFGNHESKNENELIKISENKDKSIFQIVRLKNSKISINNMKIFDLNFSDEKLKVTTNENTRILWMGPGNWLIISDQKNIESEINKSFSENDFALTNLSHSRAIIQFEGKNLKEVLKKGCPLNFSGLKKNNCANSVFHGITITIDFVSDNPEKIRILCLRSFGESLYHSITDACLEFGYKTI